MGVGGGSVVYYRGGWERLRSLLGFLGTVRVGVQRTEFRVGTDRMLLARAG